MLQWRGGRAYVCVTAAADGAGKSRRNRRLRVKLATRPSISFPHVLLENGNGCDLLVEYAEQAVGRDIMGRQHHFYTFYENGHIGQADVGAGW